MIGSTLPAAKSEPQNSHALRPERDAILLNGARSAGVVGGGRCGHRQGSGVNASQRLSM